MKHSIKLYSISKVILCGVLGYRYKYLEVKNKKGHLRGHMSPYKALKNYFRSILFIAWKIV